MTLLKLSKKRWNMVFQHLALMNRCDVVYFEKDLPDGTVGEMSKEEAARLIEGAIESNERWDGKQ